MHELTNSTLAKITVTGKDNTSYTVAPNETIEVDEETEWDSNIYVKDGSLKLKKSTSKPGPKPKSKDSGESGGDE